MEVANGPLIDLFSLADSQIRAVAGMGGLLVLGLDWSAVIRAADDMGVATDGYFYRGLKVWEMVLTDEMNRRKDDG